MIQKFSPSYISLKTCIFFYIEQKCAFSQNFGPLLNMSWILCDTIYFALNKNVNKNEKIKVHNSKFQNGHFSSFVHKNSKRPS